MSVCALIPFETKFLFNDSRDLLVEGCTIYEIKSDRVFWLSYIHQLIVGNATVVMTMNFDTLIAGYMLQISAQLDILKLKLTNISNVQRELQYQAIVQCINRYDFICWYILCHHLFIKK